MTQVGMW